jgi:hypothetical protein
MVEAPSAPIIVGGFPPVKSGELVGKASFRKGIARNRVLMIASSVSRGRSIE